MINIQLQNHVTCQEINKVMIRAVQRILSRTMPFFHAGCTFSFFATCSESISDDSFLAHQRQANLEKNSAAVTGKLQPAGYGNTITNVPAMRWVASSTSRNLKSGACFVVVV